MKGGGRTERGDVHGASVVRVRLRDGGVIDDPFVRGVTSVVRVEVVVYVGRELGTLGDNLASWIVLVPLGLENVDFGLGR